MHAPRPAPKSLPLAVAVLCAACNAAGRFASGPSSPPPEPMAARVDVQLAGQGSSQLCRGGLRGSLRSSDVVELPGADVWRALITDAGRSTERWWYAGDPFESRVTARSGRAFGVSAVSAPFGGSFRVARGSDSIGVVSSVSPARDEWQIVFSALGSQGIFSQPLVVGSNWLVDEGPEIAAGPPGRFAVAWNRHALDRGPYSLEFAVLEPGRPLVRRTLARDVLTQGLSVLYTGDGYLVVYTTSYGGPAICTMPGTAPTAERGLVGLRLGLDGEILASHRLLTQAFVTSAVAVWDGAGAGVAFSWGSGENRLAFVRLGSDGAALSPPVAVAALAGVTFTPSSIAFSRGLYWIGVTLESQLIQRVDPLLLPAAQIVAVDPSGAPTLPLALPGGGGGASVPTVTASANGVQGMFLEKLSGSEVRARSFEASCRFDGPGRAPPAANELRHGAD